VRYVQRDGDIREILRGLRNGGGFGVLCDLNTRGEAQSVPFFGRPARTLSGPFKLAIRAGAAMIPTFARRAPDGSQVVTVHPEIIPTGNTIEEKIIFSMESYNRLLETFIRKDPAQWIWMHERWKS
jgi:Kdo2-lipid IVA lauroyltransferase/acyltransferase